MDRHILVEAFYSWYPTLFRFPPNLFCRFLIHLASHSCPSYHPWILTLLMVQRSRSGFGSCDCCCWLLFGVTPSLPSPPYLYNNSACRAFSQVHLLPHSRPRPSLPVIGAWFSPRCMVAQVFDLVRLGAAGCLQACPPICRGNVCGMKKIFHRTKESR